MSTLGTERVVSVPKFSNALFSFKVQNGPLMSVFADMGVSLLVLFNRLRLLRQ